MVCVSSGSPRTPMLVRRGSRMAGRFNTDWFVVFVETPEEAPDQIDSELQRHLFANIEKAKELGAETVRLKGRDPVQAILDFARSHNIGHILVGRSQRPWWQQWLRRSIPLRLVREGTQFDIHIISLEDEVTA
jgi:two-component system sensor histidine kinase KdpD